MEKVLSLASFLQLFLQEKVKAVHVISHNQNLNQSSELPKTDLCVFLYNLPAFKWGGSAGTSHFHSSLKIKM